MKNRFIEFFIDIDGSLSFKRLQTAFFSLLFGAIIVVNIVTGKELSSSLTELLCFIVVYGYTGIAIEKFTKRGLTSVAANDEAMIEEAKAKVDISKLEAVSKITSSPITNNNEENK